MDDRLREKLRRIGVGGGERRTGEAGPGRALLEELRRIDEEGGGLCGLARGRGRDRSGRVGLEELLGGDEVDTALGPCYVIRSAYRGTYRQGRHRLEDFRQLDFGRMELFCGGEGTPAKGPEEFLFLDLETTGLSLGTGTYAFLVGLGYFDGERFWVEQVFLRDFEEEPAVLCYVQGRMEGFRTLVTFNGRRFDCPLLETRMALWLPGTGSGGQGVWDLLYPARRLWRGRLEDCRLSTLERELLEVEREGVDIEGSRIPEIYYRYVHDGDGRGLESVVYHNAMDILSLAVLAVEIGDCLEEMDPRRVDLLSVARFYERKGIGDRGGRCYRIASERGGTAEERRRALLCLAAQWKRAGRLEGAAGVWEELVETEGEGFLEASVELAKYLEHRVKDLDRAIEIVRTALDRVGPGDDRLEADLGKRLSRLERKKGRWCEP